MEKKWNGEKIPATEITTEITSKTVEFAECFGKHLSEAKDSNKLNSLKPMTTSQLRRFFGEVKRQQTCGYKQSDFVLLKPKLAYAVGRARDTKIKDFYEVMSEAMGYVRDEASFDRFVKVFEAIVAFHKANSNE